MLVTFSKHAIERINQRRGIILPSTHKLKINVDSLFFKGQYYINKQGCKCCYYIHRNTNIPVVLCVCIDTNTVLTVMTEGEQVNKCYAYYKKHMLEYS
jgi:hypothetical protein